MSGPRYDRLLAATAFALLVACPFGVFAQEAAKVTAGSAAQGSKETASSATGSVSAVPATNIDATPATPSSPGNTTEQSVVPDPLAALDPADRIVAEKIRDIL